MNNPIAAPTPAFMIGQLIGKEISEYIDRVLEECSSYMPIRTYTVLRAPYFDALKEKLDAFLEIHPEYELGDAPKMVDMTYDLLWVAVLVEYVQSEAI